MYQLILQTAFNAWNTLMFRFDYKTKTLTDYPRQALSLMIFSIFVMDFLLGAFGAYPFLGVVAGVIMGAIDVAGLLYIQKVKGHAHVVGLASAILACQLMTLVLTFTHLTSLTVFVNIWLIVAVIKLLKAPASQPA